MPDIVNLYGGMSANNIHELLTFWEILFDIWSWFTAPSDKGQLTIEKQDPV